MWWEQSQWSRCLKTKCWRKLLGWKTTLSETPQACSQESWGRVTAKTYVGLVCRSSSCTPLPAPRATVRHRRDEWDQGQSWDMNPRVVSMCPLVHRVSGRACLSLDPQKGLWTECEISLIVSCVECLGPQLMTLSSEGGETWGGGAQLAEASSGRLHLALVPSWALPAFAVLHEVKSPFHRTLQLTWYTTQAKQLWVEPFEINLSSLCFCRVLGYKKLTGTDGYFLEMETWVFRFTTSSYCPFWSHILPAKSIEQPLYPWGSGKLAIENKVDLQSCWILLGFSSLNG